MSIQYAIDDIALEYNAEPFSVSSGPVGSLLTVGNDQQCALSASGIVCIAANTFTAQCFLQDVLAVKAALNARALAALNFGLHNGTFANPTLIQTSANAAAQNSKVTVSGMSGNITKVVVGVVGFNAHFPAASGDAGVVLQSPTGQTYMAMRGVGGTGQSATNLSFVFDDAAPTQISTSNANPLVSGTYQGNSVNYNGSMTSPAPPSPYGTLLSVFNGNSPNGVWTLWAQNFLLGIGHFQTFTGGFFITITTV